MVNDFNLENIGKKKQKKLKKIRIRMRQKINTFLCCWGIFLFAGCNPINHIGANNSNVTFKSKDGEVLILDGGHFYLLAAGSKKFNRPCCDTLALGNWKADGRRFLIFNSPDWLSPFLVDINVTEKTEGGHDSVRFVIKSPLQMSYSQLNPTGKGELVYELMIDGNGTGVGYFGNTTGIETNVMAFNNPNEAEITGFTVVIRPKLNIYVRNLETLGLISRAYRVKNPQANLFEIDIPHLDYSYLTLKRLNDDYLKVLNKNTLRWNGKDYIRKG